MAAFVITFLVGILCAVIGSSIRKGNISLLHDYHRQRVSEEDRVPMCRQVGFGTILIGVSIGIFSILGAVAVLTGQDAPIGIGTGILVAGIVIGAWVSLAAVKKFNKGIF